MTIASAATLRLFVALWPDAAVRARLARERDRWTWSATAAPVSDDALHVTLQFIGSVPKGRLDEVVANLAVPFEPFELAFGRHALWHNGIAVMEPLSVPPALLQLHASSGEALEGLALPVEPRPYRPHITWARRAGGSSLPPQAAPLHWPITGFALVESRPGSGGYEPLAFYKW